jgi:hypothetical protein
MKTFKTLVLLLTIIIVSASASKAQFNNGESGGSFTLNFIGAMPLGEFAESDFANVPTYAVPFVSASPLLFDKGNASMGAGLGFKVDYRFDFGMSVYIGADVLWNQLNKDMRSQYEKKKKTKPNYINFPIMLGLGYQCYFGNVFGLYANAGAGLGLLYLTPEGWSDEMIDFRLSTAFSWQAGGGILLGEHISIGAHYHFLGNHTVEVKEPSVTNLMSMLPSRKMNMSILSLKLGIIF